MLRNHLNALPADLRGDGLARRDAHILSRLGIRIFIGPDDGATSARQGRAEHHGHDEPREPHRHRATRFTPHIPSRARSVVKPENVLLSCLTPVAQSMAKTCHGVRPPRHGTGLSRAVYSRIV